MKKLLLLLFAVSIFSCQDNSDDTTEIIQPVDRNDNGITLNIDLSGSLQNAAFSPNGESIIFTRFINGYNLEPSELYIFNIESEQLSLLISDGSGNINLPGSSWLNDKIVFASSREPHDEIFMIDENGESGDEIKITNRENKVAYEPTLSPDDAWTVFESHILDVEENGIITKYKIDGSSDYIELTDPNNDCRQPNWSPNGDKILYQRLNNNQWDIWIMNTDGSNVFKVTSGEGDKTDASFTADGQFIIYSTDFELDIANIYKIAITGGEATRLSNFSGYDGAPSISPKGNQLIFESVQGEPDNSSGTKLVLLNL